MLLRQHLKEQQQDIDVFLVLTRSIESIQASIDEKSIENHRKTSKSSEIQAKIERITPYTEVKISPSFENEKIKRFTPILCAFYTLKTTTAIKYKTMH
jgi:hypothetical protein